MPASVPRAGFNPLPTNLDLRPLVEKHGHWDFCPRITYQTIKEHGVDSLEKLVRKHVIQGGKPLVIEGFEEVLDPWTFSAKWLKDNVGEKVESAWDLVEKKPIPLTIKHYLNSINAVTGQHFRPPNPSRSQGPQRIYLKDIDCPEVWQQKLAELIPPFLYYLNDSTGEPGGPGAKALDHAAVPGRRLGKGIAPAGDLMSSFPPEMRAENLMCYIGHEGTYTPSHREMCATMGHNIMVNTSEAFDDDGKPERPGSSIWFMTEASDRQIVSEYWLSKLGHDIEVEKHFAQLVSWENAPFKVYIVEQKIGDFVLVPPLAPHQVWNRGSRTVKVAWNRSTVDTLDMALKEAVPKAKVVCRDEQYKNKAMVYFTLCKYSDLLAEAMRQSDRLPADAGRALLYKGKVRTLQRDFRKLFDLFKTIMLSEMLPEVPGEKFEYIPFDSNVTCAYCRGNIFNRFLSCPACPDQLGRDESEPYDVCMECYAMGRSCKCISGLQWVEQFKWKELAGRYEQWRQQIITLAGDVDRTTPLALTEERKRQSKRTLAEVVREQLKRRPFIDITKPKVDWNAELTDEETAIGDDGFAKRRVKKRSKEFNRAHASCHVCKNKEERWKMAQCTRCDKWWCYATLFRGHDDMPLDVMENPDWECAHCQGVCFAGTCRLDPRQTPYKPKGTLLGHDTKKVADERSVEALIDLRISNLNWIREEEGQAETAQMRRAFEESEKARVVEHENEDEDVVPEPEEDIENEIIMPDDNEDEFLDPELRSEHDMARRLTQFNESLASPSLGQERHPGLDRPSANGYVPAETAGYARESYDDDAYEYPEPRAGEVSPHPHGANDDPEFAPFLSKGRQPYGAKGNKRGRQSEGNDLVMQMPKRRRATEVSDQIAARSSNTASRQYREIQERKALEEAKRKGNWIATKARLRGRSKMVRIKIPGSTLRQIVLAAKAKRAKTAITQPESSGAAKDIDSSLILQSDVQKPKAAATSKQEKPKKRKRQGSDNEDEMDASGEEIGDEEDDENFTAPVNGGTSRKSDGGPRRVPAYLRKAGDEELPSELPQTFRDPRKGKLRDPNATPRDPDSLPQRDKNGVWISSKSKTIPDGQIPAPTKTGRPRGRPRKDAIQPAVDAPMSSPGPRATQTGSDRPNGAHTDKSRRGQSITEAEMNRLTKLAALDSLEQHEEEEDDMDLDRDIGEVARAAFEAVQAAPVAKMGGGPRVGTSSGLNGMVANGAAAKASPAPSPAVRKSIFDRKGPGGKKIKIKAKS